MEATTHWRSSRADSFFNEHVKRLPDAGVAEDADPTDKGVAEDVVEDVVVSARRWMGVGGTGGPEVVNGEFSELIGSS